MSKIKGAIVVDTGALQGMLALCGGLSSACHRIGREKSQCAWLPLCRGSST